MTQFRVLITPLITRGGGGGPPCKDLIHQWYQTETRQVGFRTSGFGFRGKGLGFRV